MGALAILCCAGLRVGAQGAAGQAFDVASVKPHDPNVAPPRVRVSTELGGVLRIVDLPLRDIVRMSYQVTDDQLVGGPDWIRTERFDVLAKAGVDLPPMPPPPRFDAPAHPVFPLLRALLDDRFGLVVHHETRTITKYILVTARPDKTLGPRLKPSGTDCAAVTASRRAAQQGGPPVTAPKPGEAPPCGMIGFVGPPVRIVADSQSLAEMTALLASFVGREVSDRTGLNGLFSYTLEVTPDLQASSTSPAAANDAPSIFTAVQEQLGLKLESVREPADVLVIDRIERPTAN